MALHCADVATDWPPVAVPQRFQVWVVGLTATVFRLLTMGKSRRVTSVLRKKNSLSFLMGPPTVPPAWFRFSEGTNVASGSRALNPVLRSEEHTSELQS